jgi:hypothetical protein
VTVAAALALVLALATSESSEALASHCFQANLPSAESARLCLEMQARQFEVSAESPDNIATAIMSACSSEIRAYGDAAVSCFAGSIAVTNGMESALRDGIEERFRNYIIKTVVQIRAARNSPK